MTIVTSVPRHLVFNLGGRKNLFRFHGSVLWVQKGVRLTISEGVGTENDIFIKEVCNTFK